MKIQSCVWISNPQENSLPQLEETVTSEYMMKVLIYERRNKDYKCDM